MCVLSTHFGREIGLFVAVEDSANIHVGKFAIETSKEIPLSKFDSLLAQSGENILNSTDCLYLTYRKRRVIAFVPYHLAEAVFLLMLRSPEERLRSLSF